MPVPIPQSFRFAGVYCGIKRDASRKDCALVVSDVPAVAAGVYTKNLVFAAPVAFDRARTPGAGFRAVAMNSGNANACTGERGLRDAERMAQLAAEKCDAPGEAALVLSTGIIGEYLRMPKITAGLAQCAEQLANTEEALISAAQGIMTTDTVHKVAGRTISLGKRKVTVTGMCKGAAMIAPNMGTMLGLVLTDAHLTTAAAQQALSTVVEDTFNCISVDGHMSTNDTVLLLANGAAGGLPLATRELEQFQAALLEVCTELSRAIPADGEGATHLITIDVTGCASRERCAADRQDRRRQPVGQMCDTRRRPQLGTDRFSRRLLGRKFQPGQSNASPQRLSALPRRSARSIPRRAGFSVDQKSARYAHPIGIRRRRRANHVLHRRSNRRLRPPECRLSHLRGVWCLVVW